MNKLAGILVTILFATNALGNSVSSRDWQAAGDGLLTFDAATNLEWLDSSVTTSTSYLEVESLIALGGTLDGFRVASLDEIWTLMTDFGIEMGPVGQQIAFSGDDRLTVLAFLDLTWEGNEGFGYGLTSALFSPYPDIQRSTLIGQNNELTEAFINACCGWEQTDSFNNLSTWLVRDAAPVPVPGALVLFSSALIALRRLRR